MARVKRDRKKEILEAAVEGLFSYDTGAHNPKVYRSGADPYCVTIIDARAGAGTKRYLLTITDNP